MKFKVSPFVFAMGLLAAFTGKIQLFVSYLTAMTLHEFAHAEIAGRLGYKMESIKIMPYGAALSGDLGGVTGGDECKIALAGPLCNVFLATVFTAIWWLIPETYFFTLDFVTANLFLAAFNILPVYPLDGGRIFYALVKSKVKNVHKAILIGNSVFAVIFIVLFFVVLHLGFNLTLLIAAAFMLAGAFIPEKRCRYGKIYDMAYRVEKIKRCLPVKIFAVMKDTTVKQMKNKLGGNYFSIFKVVDGDGVIYEYELDKMGESDKNKTAWQLKPIKKSRNAQ